MAIQNEPGSLNATSKVQGTLPSVHLGTFGAGKITYGTLGGTRVPYLGGSVRTGYRYKFGTLNSPGTTVPRFVSVNMTFRPGALNSSQATLAQRGLGTIANMGVAAAGVNLQAQLSGWVYPNQGSWVIRNVGGTPPLINFGSTWFVH